MQRDPSVFLQDILAAAEKYGNKERGTDPKRICVLGQPSQLSYSPLFVVSFGSGV